MRITRTVLNGSEQSDCANNTYCIEWFRAIGLCFIPRDHIHPGISGPFLFLWVSKISVPVTSEILFGTQNVHFFKS